MLGRLWKRYWIPILSLMLLAFSIHGYLNYGKDPKHCDGNYIIPSYSTIKFSSSKPDLDKRYTLKRHHENDRKKLGTPVLFLPGNGGNYKQIRSFGSVAVRIWLHEFPRLRPLDLYALETNEELSAFNPQILADQAFYANEAVQAILDIYKKQKLKDIPTHVYIIGHSMGGVVGRYMPLLDNYKADSVRNIFTLSTPHKEAPVPISRAISSFYNTLNRYWKDNHVAEKMLSNMTLVSVAGGTRDTTLDSSLTFLEGISNPEFTVHVFSSSVPGIWSSADHEGAVWCDQTLQVLSRTILHIEQLGEENSRPPIHRIWEILKQFQGVKVINTTIERILSTDVLLQLSEPNLTIPNLETGLGEIRIHHLGIPPPDLRHLFKFRLITNVENVEMFSCEGEENVLHHKCLPLSQDMKSLPIPAAALNFSLVFRRESSPPSENRKEWFGWDLNLDDRMKGHQFFLIKVPPASKGFLFADMTKPKESYHEFISMLVHLPLFPYRHTLKTKSVLTVIRLPRIKDGLLKYKVWVVPFGELKPAFPPLILQEVMNEKKPISPDGSVITIYSPRYGKSNQGMIFHVWCDPGMEGFDFYFGIDYWGSLSVLSGRYRGLVISLVFSLVCVCFTIPGRYDNMEQMLFRRVFYSAFFPLVLLITILAYFYSMSAPAFEYVIGDHELVMSWYFTAISLFSFGVVQGLYYVVKTIIFLCSLMFGRFLLPLLVKRVRLAVCALLFVATLFIPAAVVISVMFLFSFFACIARASAKVNSTKVVSTHQVFCLLVQLFVVAFEIPNLLQYFEFWSRGISTYPIPMNRLSGISLLFFGFFVQPLSAAPSRNMTLVSWTIAIILMVFGWKHVYLIPELGSVMMLFASFCAALEESIFEDAGMNPSSSSKND